MTKHEQPRKSGCSNSEAGFCLPALRESAKPDVASASEELIAQTSDSGLSRVNALAFAARHSLNEEEVSASRVQGLAKAHSIFVTRQVVERSEASKLSRASEVAPTAQQRSLRGIANQFEIFEIT